MGERQRLNAPGPATKPQNNAAGRRLFNGILFIQHHRARRWAHCTRPVTKQQHEILTVLPNARIIRSPHTSSC